MNMGIWIDHRNAVLVSLGNGSATVSRLESEVESRAHSAGGWRAGGTAVAQCVSNEQRVDERHKHQLHAFYRNVIKAAEAAERVLIFGPGAAKQELAAEFGKIKGAHAEVAAVEARDKMTEPQITAHVKTFFQKK